jgi:Tol biopolymer transport system component
VNEFDDLDQLERELGPSLRLALRHIAAEITDDKPTSSLGPNGDGAVGAFVEVPLVEAVPETVAGVAKPDIEVAEHRRRLPPIRLVAGGLVAAGLVAVLALVVRNGSESEPAVAPPAANGLIAFAGNQGDGSAQSDIYVVARDGTGLRALTSTPELAEYAPAWSPDGSRLAFVRTDLPAIPHMRDCTPHCEFVVVDPKTGVETFSADVPRGSVPVSLAWSSDGRAIVAHSINCGSGGCGGGNSVIADLDSGALTTFRGYDVTWSPDGEWLSLVRATGVSPPRSLLLARADLIAAGDDVDVAELPGVRPLLEEPGEEVGGVEWMPDGSAIVVSGERSIDVMTVADGQRRTLIEDGFNPVVSPDGSQIAYLHGSMSADVNEIWVAAADGSDPRRVTVSSTPPVWSPDGSLLVASDANDGWFTVQPDGTGKTQITPFMPRAPLGLPDAHAVCCPDYRPSWQPLAPGSSIAAPDDRRVGFVGLPPEGASPSTPQRGELVVYLAGPEIGRRTWVYADGRMIWHRYADLPEGANSEFTGFLEQRLTPEGVELVRSEVASLGLLEPASTARGLARGSSARSWYATAANYAASTGRTALCSPGSRSRIRRPGCPRAPGRTRRSGRTCRPATKLSTATRPSPASWAGYRARSGTRSRTAP